MAAGEPETKKLKLDERDDPIFDQFRSDKSKMQLLEYALLVLSKGADSDLKLCMKKIVCEDANADVSFSSATVRTENYTTVGSMPTCGIATGIIFTDGVIILNSFFRYGLLPKNETVKMLLAKLLKFLSKSDQDVLLERKGYRESEWAVIIIQHLISQLTVDSNYIIDSSYSNKPLEKCPCKYHDDLVTIPGDTSYGCLKGWLGHADILVVDTLPIKVLTDMANLIPDDQSDTQSVTSVSSFEVKSKEEFNSTKDECELMAQTIVFSFLQEKYNRKKLKNFLVPGIGVDAKSLLFYFYDCENDLLMATPCLKTFSSQVNEPLIVDHIVFLWLTLNYRYFCSGPDKIMKNYQAGFKHAEKYRKEVQMPAHRRYSSTRNQTLWYKNKVVHQMPSIDNMVCTFELVPSK